MPSHFFKFGKTIVLYGYNEIVPARIGKLILLCSSIIAKLRQGAEIFIFSTVFGSMSLLTPLHALPSFQRMEVLFNKLATVLLVNLNMFVMF